MIIPYASRTGTRRNLAALRENGWRLLVSAKGPLRPEGFQYALDNGAWTAFRQGHPFDVQAFEKAVSKLGSGADWIVAPDIVAGGLASLRLTVAWLPRLEPIAPVLIAVQNGMHEDDVRALLGPRVGIFVGGDTVWKLATMGRWGALARERQCWMHVGRVNSMRRIAQCNEAGAHSFDGTSTSRYVKTVGRLSRAVVQGHFAWHA